VCLCVKEWNGKGERRGEEEQTAAVYIRNRLALLAMAVAVWQAGTAGCGWHRWLWLAGWLVRID